MGSVARLAMVPEGTMSIERTVPLRTSRWTSVLRYPTQTVPCDPSLTSVGNPSKCRAPEGEAIPVGRRAECSG